MSNLLAHAKNELLAVGFPPVETAEDGPEKWISECVLQLIDTFAAQGHSGGSAPTVISLFSKLASFEPLSPITGDDTEWFEHDGGMFQNKRNSAVFKKGKAGKPYYIDAVIWRTQNDGSYSGSAKLPGGDTIYSRQFCQMPFTVKTFYVDVIEKEVAPNHWEFTIKDPAQLNEVFTYYNRDEQ